MLFEDLPGSAASAAPPSVPPEARGAIGGLAALYGLGTKQDGDDVPDSSSLHERTLCPMPAADPSWSPLDVETIAEASERAATIGEYRLANLWRRNLARPKSVYADVEALLRMLASIERSHAGRARALEPVEPDMLYESLAAVPLAEAGYSAAVVPHDLARAVVAVLNARLATLARAGFRTPVDVHAGNAPPDVLAVKSSISALRGATVRLINQIGHLQTASRLGQTAYNPMTLGRRRGLLASALAQLAEDMQADPSSPESLGLMTDDVRARWAERDAASPPRPTRYRNLFAWSERDRPDPAFLDVPDLERLIQEHPDLGYVEQLRQERANRAGAAGSAY